MNAAATLKNGLGALQVGDLGAARAAAEAVLAERPGLGPAHVVLGRVELEEGRYVRAAETFARAASCDPSSAEAVSCLGLALHQLGRIKDAYTAHVRALELAPDSTSVALRAARFLMERGELDAAEALLEHALAPDRKSAEDADSALAAWLDLRERRGDIDGACDLIAAHTDVLAAGYQANLPAARVLRRLGRPDQAAGLLSTIDLARLTPQQRASLLFALGDAHDERGAHDEAFRAWRGANRLRGVRFDGARLARDVDDLTQRWTPAAFARTTRATNSDPRPVLVVGVPRTGTTLVERILDAHPAVVGRGELDDLPAIARELREREELRPGAASPAELDVLAERYLRRLCAGAEDAARVVDKLPHNAFFLAEAARLLPSARVVRCVRDPLDTGLSIYSRDFHEAHDYAGDLAAIGAFQRQHARLMEHWGTCLPLPVLELRYETLVGDPEAAARALLDFVGLPWDPAVLRFHESGRHVATASYAQVREPIHGRAVGRAGAYAAHLGPLRAGLAG